MPQSGNASLVNGVGRDLQLAAALRHARTPLDVLGGLTEHGAGLGLGLWAMAMVTARGPAVWMCSDEPLEPDALSSSLVHFLVHASSHFGGETRAEQWIGAKTVALCLTPAAAPVSVEVTEYRDRALWLCDETQVVLRAARLAPGEGSERVWDEAQTMVRAATPYLRAVTLGACHDGALLCPASGAYAEPYFLDSLDREIERARRHLGQLSLAVVELRPADLSHELGAFAHARIGGHLRGAVRRTDLVGRLGPRSYGVFFYNTGPRPALISAGRIADALAGDRVLAGDLSFAIGVSGWEITGPDATSLLSQARAAATEALLIAPGRAFVYV